MVFNARNGDQVTVEIHLGPHESRRKPSSGSLASLDHFTRRVDAIPHLRLLKSIELHQTARNSSTALEPEKMITQQIR